VPKYKKGRIPHSIIVVTKRYNATERRFTGSSEGKKSEIFLQRGNIVPFSGQGYTKMFVPETIEQSLLVLL
jgi:hypothetical protein